MDIGRDQVARLMRDQGIEGASRAKKRFTTKSDPAHVRAPDLVNRNFTAARPDALWVADFTYCSTWSGIVYMAFIIDVCSRRLVGWKAARSMTALPRRLRLYVGEPASPRPVSTSPCAIRSAPS